MAKRRRSAQQIAPKVDPSTDPSANDSPTQGRKDSTVRATASFLPLNSLEAVHFDYRDELDLPGLRPSPSPLWTVGSGLSSLQSASLEQDVEDARRRVSSGFGAGAPPKSWKLPNG